jgi:tetratricopeptide (TPR) repeat protein
LKFKVRNQATVADFLVLYSMKYLLAFFTIATLTVSCGTDNTTDSTTQNEPQETVATQPRSKMDSINKLIENDKYNPKLLAIRANLHLAAQNVNAAKNDINLANTIDTNVALLREARGELAYMMNRNPIARIEWEKCIKLEPENVTCLMRLTELYIALQNYDRALELVNRLIDVNSNDAQAYFMKGIIVRDKYRDTTLALQYFQNAVDLKQDYVDALDMMGVMLAAKGDTLAKYYYQRILAQQPRRDDIYYKLGVYYMNRGETNRALEAYTKATQINPRATEAFYSMAYMHVELRQFQKARDLFTKSIQADDRNYRAYYGRGYAFEMLGDVMNAKKDYQKVLDMLPMHQPSAEALARVNRTINQ